MRGLVRDGQIEDAPYCLNRNGGCHFTESFPSFGKCDGNFRQTRATFPKGKMQFDLEPISFCMDGIPIEMVESRHAQSLEPARYVREREAQHKAYKLCGGGTQQQAVFRPVDHTQAIQIARANSRIGPLIQSLQQTWDIMRVMRKVGVNFDTGIVAMLNSPPESRAISTAQSLLAFALNQEKPLPEVGVTFNNMRRSIRRAVINHQHVQTRIRLQQNPEQAGK